MINFSGMFKWLLRMVRVSHDSSYTFHNQPM
nr:MAG TPA: hypothetical protein [Caudoviricetes sp.]